MRLLTSLILSLPLVGAYAIFALGIVLIYRASKVLNLAHGAMAMIPAYVLYSLVRAGIPTVIAFPIAIASGAALGLGVERIFVRRLRSASATAQTVGTVAALGIMVAFAAKVWGTTPREAVRIFPDGFVSVGASGIKIGELGLFAVACLVAVGLHQLLQRTDLGLMMRGTAESRLAASLHGVDPDRITQLTWALGGALAALAGILLAAVTNLNPYVLTLQALPGFIAALLGGLGSLPGAVAGAAVVGVTQGLVPVLGALGRAEGAPQLVLAAVALIVMASRGRTGAVASEVREPSSGSDVVTSRRPTMPSPMTVAVAVVGVGLFLWLAPQSLVGSANLATGYAMVAISIVILTGWVGQISLGHAALVGIGAYVTGIAAGGLGIPFPLSIVPACLAAAGAAALLGTIALRVRGLYLAVATLVFSWMASEFLFRQSWFISHDQIPARALGGEGTAPSFDFTDPRVFFVFGWMFVVAAVYLASNLRDFKIGRAFFAVRGSEMAAASLGIDVMRTKLIAFAVSGTLAGAAGNLLMSDARVVSADQFTFSISLFFLAIAVVGGLGSIPGAIISSLLFAGLYEVFFRVPALGGFLEIVSALLLGVVLVAYPGGLARLLAQGGTHARRIRSNIDGRRAPAREPEESMDDQGGPVIELEPATILVEPVPSALLTTPAVPVLPRELRERVLEASGVTVRFGGLTAVDNAGLRVHRGEIVGLIGPNGAGKTTLFNAIAGFNVPTEGTIHLLGQDVTVLPVHRRAALGVARTFQAIQLFGALSVFENLLVATHCNNATRFSANAFATSEAVEAERTARARVREVLATLDLLDIADRPTADLPFGVLRMVEVARALVTGFPLIMLDEPASGLDNAETDRLIDILRFVRSLGVTQLLIEHDVRMVTSVSDHIYVLDQGRIIAEGPPDEIRRNPAVVAAYLGESESEPVGVA